MTSFRCAVIQIRDEWTLAYNGQCFGAFRDPVRAFTAAMQLAQDVSRAGGSAEILMQTPAGELSLQAKI